MDFQTLRKTDPSAFRRAGSAWEEFVAASEQRVNDFGRDVAETLAGGIHWKGQASDAAAGHADRLVAEERKWLDLIRQVGPALSNAGDEAETCQRRLEGVLAEIEALPEPEWRVTEDGRVFYPEDQRERGERYLAEIEQLIAAADAADAEAAAKLEPATRTLSFLDDSLPTQPTAAGVDALVQAATSGWSVEGSASATGPSAGVQASDVGQGKLEEYKAYATLAGANARGAIRRGDFELKGKASASVGAQTEAAASITDDGVNVKAGASVGGRAQAAGRVGYGPVGAYGRAEGFVGGEGYAGISARPTGFSAQAGVFAGAKTKLAAGGDVGGVSAGVTAEGWAGRGAEANAKYGMGQDGKFHVGASAGASPAIGGKAGFEVAVDPEEVADTVDYAADQIGGLWRSPMHDGN